jgi:hypothetical protein
VAALAAAFPARGALTGNTYETALADNPGYESQTDQMWIEYVRTLGFRVRRTRLILPGHHYFCFLSKETEDDPRDSHAIAIDDGGACLILWNSRASSRLWFWVIGWK